MNFASNGRSIITNSQINAYLDEAGIPHAYNGYKFLMYGIRLLLDEKAHRSAIMELYEMIAKRFDTDWGAVERAMRAVIRNSKHRGTSNREFLARAVDQLIFSE